MPSINNDTLSDWEEIQLQCVSGELLLVVEQFLALDPADPDGKERKRHLEQEAGRVLSQPVSASVRRKLTATMARWWEKGLLIGSLATIHGDGPADAWIVTVGCLSQRNLLPVVSNTGGVQGLMPLSQFRRPFPVIDCSCGVWAEAIREGCFLCICMSCGNCMGIPVLEELLPPEPDAAH
ncbi:MAG: hypothetical protein F4118_11345 [Acidimicrobiaceae bacterium]|nr:hypothetical protein [Acidimicrobiaceae bacterium]MYI37002.1 hypothetical protein [Acidimicrobiaceae bacterium]